MKRNKMSVLDLFSGIGGFSLGLERAGMETVAFCEIQEFPYQILKKNFELVPTYKDVNNLSYRDGILNESPVARYHPLRTNIDLICGGFPCQDISVAGKKKGLIDDSGNTTRSGLWFQFKRLIKEIEPKYVIIENVANLRSNGLATVIKDLWEIGYGCEWHIIPASSVGALHERERCWIIAHPNSEQLWIKHGRRIGTQWTGPVQSQLNGEAEQMANTSSIRLDGCIGEERSLPINKEWNNSPSHPKGQQCESESWQALQILSKGAIDRIRSAYSSDWELVPTVRRVVNGVSYGLDRKNLTKKQKEKRKERSNRITALGNSIVPQIAELIGRCILDYESRISGTL